MPINTWNFFRAVSVGSDHASWLSQNPQVEEGRIGGNKEFDQDVTDQYQYEVELTFDCQKTFILFLLRWLT